jgi:exopolyphosphatase
LECLVTIGDIRGSLSSQLYATFAPKSSSFAQPRFKADIVLIDHNAPQIPGLSSEDISSRFNLTGAIDHHIDENTAYGEATPWIVKTGIGSCCSLVIQYLQDKKLWRSPSKDENHTQVAKLALAPILIDTVNLTATGDKISDTDRQAVKFLESHITPSDPTFDRTAFYEEIQESKSKSLNLLTMEEIFERDYKEWTETPSNTSKPVNMGIASLVREISWLVKQAGSTSKLTEAMHSFARKTNHKLSILVLLTKGNGPDGEFRKELAIVAYGDFAIEALKIFEADAGELQLKEWNEDQGLLDALESIAGSESLKSAYRVWWQGDVSKSRKQVAPLLREAVKKA